MLNPIVSSDKTINVSNSVTKDLIEIKNLKSDQLPPYFCWRDVNGVDFTTPIRNQAPYPSCESFAITAAVETMVQKEVNVNFGCDLSEAHLFFFSGGNINWGSYPENDTQFLKDFGIPDESCWPYPTEKYQYPLNTTCPDWQNRTIKILHWSYLPEDSIAIKNALVNNGPVPTYFVVYEDFIDHKKGIYQHRWGKLWAVHYVTIVGYNDNPGYWVCKNSWGTKYQDNGWFKIKYGECSIEKKSFYITGVYGKFPIIFVDDDNKNGPWDGTKDNPYKHIQDGINNAYAGYTVYVKNGTYFENVIVNETINLVGENRDNTIIDGGGSNHVIVVSSPNVKVSGFSIQNSGTKPFDAGIKTLTLKANLTVTDNIIQNNDIGIFLNYAYTQTWNVIKDNIVQNNRDGIYTHWSYNTEISNNLIELNSEDGIETESSQKLKIKNNKIRENDECGIYFRSGSNKNKIKKNGINSNKIGIRLENSYWNKITYNNIINNKRQANFYDSMFNIWHKNFWDRPRLIPKIIHGRVKIGTIGLLKMNFDWRPTLLAYRIVIK